MRAGGTAVGDPMLDGAGLPVAGPGARCSREITRAEVQDALAHEIVGWLAPSHRSGVRLDPLALAQAVAQEVRWVGTHHLDRRLVEDLATIREQHRGRDARLDHFLDCVLAKHDGRYWNRTYLCLPVLERIIDGPSAPLSPIALSALLAADIVRHELCASRRGKVVSPLDRPDGRTLRTRVRHAMRFMAAQMGAAAAVDLVAEVAHEPEARLPDLLRDLPIAPEPWAAEWLALTVLPVSTVHDEAFFIRTLQAHEMVFTSGAQRIGQATAALRGGQPSTASDLIAQATILLDRGASLFRLVATMRAEAFHTFRDFTQGASAIQSEAYKRFESRCATPPASRLRSAAFDSVPAVQAEASSGQDTLADAFLAVRNGRDADRQLSVVVDRLASLEISHRRWKVAHLALATRMLGEVRGSGYTAGVPYLRAWVDHRLFGTLPEVTAAVAAGGR